MMILLVSLYQQKRIRYASITVLIVMIGSWQWNRFQAIEDSDIVVFNSNSPVIACKHEGQVRAFYIGKKKKADRLIEAYEKVMPGAIRMDSLENGITSVKMGETFIEIAKDEDGIWIHHDKKSTYIRMRYRLPEDEADAIIDMPYLENRNGHYNLSKGAYRKKL